MKVNASIIALVVAVAISACTSTDNTQELGDIIVNSDTLAKSTETESTSMCFLRAEGKSNKDTTSIELVFKDNKVTGQMHWHPFEKDSRKGTLSGTLNGDTVYAEWSFMQEGMQDTLGVQFLVIGNNLTQKPLKLNTQTGRQQTDASAAFTLQYRPSISFNK